MAHGYFGHFMPNSGWLALAAVAFDLARAVGVAAASQHAKAVTATICVQLINVATRITCRLPA